MEESKVADEPAAESNGGASAKAPGGAFPPNQNGVLPYGPIPEVGEECGKSRVRVVSTQDTDERTFVQVLQGMEAAAEDPVGGGTKGDRKREEPVHDPGPVRGRAVHQCDSGFFVYHEGGERVGPAVVPQVPDEDMEEERRSVEAVEELESEKGKG